MGNAASREQHHQYDGSGGAELGDGGTEKFNTMAALSSRLINGSGDSLNHLTGEPASINHSSQPSSGNQRTILSASLKDKGLEALPLELFSLTDLNALDLSKNKLRYLPAELGRLKKLKRLALGSNNITIVPDCFGELKDLTWLDFTHNDIHTITEAIGDLPSLSSLGASDCRLTEFPEPFCRLKSLKKLGIFNNMISSLPAQIGNLRGLTKLDLSGNALVTLPKEIGQLTELTWLNLSKNQLESLPDELGNLVKLQELGLSFNKLKRLPDLSALKDLSLLPVYSNELEEVGDWICQMQSLSKLDLSFNQLKSIPEGIFRIQNLTFINLRHNKLESVPAYNKSAPRERSSTLQIIDLRDNQLQFIPISLMGPKLAELKCLNNPLIGEPGFLPDPGPRVKSLRELASNSLTYYGIPVSVANPNLYHEHKHLAKRARLCENCNRKYLIEPVRYVIFAETSDHPFAAFIMEACSISCMAGFQSMLSHSLGSPVSSDPRSPRSMLE